MRALAVAVSCVLAAPALADYYVVQDVETKKSTVVDKMLVDTTQVAPVGPASFKTRKDAEEGIKRILVCTIK